MRKRTRRAQCNGLHESFTEQRLERVIKKSLTVSVAKTRAGCRHLCAITHAHAISAVYSYSYTQSSFECLRLSWSVIKMHAVIRYEMFRISVTRKQSKLFSHGLTWQAHPPIQFEAQYFCVEQVNPTHQTFRLTFPNRAIRKYAGTDAVQWRSDQCVPYYLVHPPSGRALPFESYLICSCVTDMNAAKRRLLWLRLADSVLSHMYSRTPCTGKQLPYRSCSAIRMELKCIHISRHCLCGRVDGTPALYDT